MSFTPNFAKALKIDWFQRNPEIVAKELIGKVLVKVEKDGTILAGIISETEAYLSEGDFSSHSACGLTKRNAPMFSDGGVLYVYRIYGAHLCINFVSESKGIGSAVLIRAVIPISGIEIMSNRRGVNDLKKLCKGPGNLTKSFGFMLEDNFKPLFSDSLFIQEYLEVSDRGIEVTERIGISKSQELPLRFFLIDNAYKL